MINYFSESRLFSENVSHHQAMAYDKITFKDIIVIVDTFSRMPMKNTTPLIMVGKEEPTADPLDCHFSVTDDTKMVNCIAYLPSKECYLNLPPDSTVDNPLDMEMIKEQQDADNDLLCQATKYAGRYGRKSVSSVDNVLCYVKPGDPWANWKIALPRSMLQPFIC